MDEQNQHVEGNNQINCRVSFVPAFISFPLETLIFYKGKTAIR